MPKYLLEYKDRPVILNHDFDSVERITFLRVFADESANEVKCLEYEKLGDASKYKLKERNEAIFTKLQGTKDGKTVVKYDLLSVQNNSLKTYNYIFLKKGEFQTWITISPKDIYIWISAYDTSPKKVSAYKLYTKDEISEAKKKYPNKENYDHYYDYIPKLEDWFHELLFILNIVYQKCDQITITEDLDAFLLQAKLRQEGLLVKVVPAESRRKKKAQRSLSAESNPLEDLIGLEKIKLEILELKSLASLRKKRMEVGLPVTPTTLHLVFTGNPGTGKTTVARLLGKIYKDIGLLETDKVIEVSRTDLVAEYVGQTAPKTKNVFDSALGGILFIDEAYSLFKDSNDFGKEAVETLLKLMEDHREEIVVIIAGYTKEIENLLASNPGLSSRFPTRLHFDDYSVKELVLIFEKMVKDYNNTMKKEASSKIKKLIKERYTLGAFTSNARAVRNLFDIVVKKQSMRLAKNKNYEKEELTVFTSEDIPETFW